MKWITDLNVEAKERFKARRKCKKKKIYDILRQAEISYVQKALTILSN